MITLIIDVDGTLVADNNILPSKEIIDLLKILSSKHNIVFATGRPYSGLKEIFSVLGTSHNAVTLNGASIYKKSKKEALAEFTFDKEVLSNILKKIWMEEDVTISGYSNSEWYIRRTDNNIIKEAELLQIIPKTIKLQNFLNKEILKISLIFNNEDELDKYFLLLNKENASISKSAKKHIEITAKGVDKAFGYRKLIGKLGIDMNKSISILIGNGDNDIPISNEVDISYSVANSSTEYRNKAEYALAKNNGEALLGLVNAINKNQDFGRKVDLSKPKLLDIINEDMEIVSIGQPVARVHKCSSLHLSVCIIFENINGDILCRLKKNKFNDLKSLYCCPYNFHIPSVYTVDRAINQFVKNFKGNFKEVRKLGFKHIKNGDENEICHFFTAKVIEDKKTFESRIHKWCSEKILKERIEKKKVTKYLKTYYLLKTLR